MWCLGSWSLASHGKSASSARLWSRSNKRTLPVVGDKHPDLGGFCNDLLSEETSATALDGVQVLVDFWMSGHNQHKDSDVKWRLKITISTINGNIDGRELIDVAELEAGGDNELFALEAWSHAQRHQVRC